MKAEDKISFLKNVAPFSSLDGNDIGIIAETMDLKRFPPKADIIRQGEEGTHFYVVVSGLAKVALHDKEEREKIIGFLGEGDCFGETSLLTKGVRTAAIQAVEETTCLVQDKEQFLLMTQKHPAFLSFFNQLLTHRMRVVYNGLLGETAGMNTVEPYLYTKQVKDMMPILDTFIDESSTIRDAAANIIGNSIESVALDRQGSFPAIMWSLSSRPLKHFLCSKSETTSLTLTKTRISAATSIQRTAQHGRSNY